MAIEVNSFPRCCGLNILTGFGYGSNQYGNTAELNKDQVVKGLTTQMSGLGSLAAYMVVLNGKQNRIVGPWLLEFGFELLNEQPYAHPNHRDHEGEYIYMYRCRDEKMQIRKPKLQPEVPKHPDGPNGLWMLVDLRGYRWRADCGWSNDTNGSNCCYTYEKCEQQKNRYGVGGEIKPYIEPKVASGSFGGGAQSATYDTWAIDTHIENNLSGNRYRVLRDIGDGRFTYTSHTGRTITARKANFHRV